MAKREFHQGTELGGTGEVRSQIRRVQRIIGDIAERADFRDPPVDVTSLTDAEAKLVRIGDRLARSPRARLTRRDLQAVRRAADDARSFARLHDRRHPGLSEPALEASFELEIAADEIEEEL